MQPGNLPAHRAPLNVDIATFDFKAALLAVGWLSILFGFMMGGLLLLLDPASQTLGELVRQVARTTLICVGLALGMASLRWRASTMGLAGLLTAPCATYVVVVVHNVMAALLNVASAGASDPSIALALAKGVEYGSLGVAVGWLEAHARGGFLVHALVGLVIGLVFGSLLLAFSASEMNLAAWLVNEVLFPAGCATIIFVGNAIGKRAVGASVAT